MEKLYKLNDRNLQNMCVPCVLYLKTLLIPRYRALTSTLTVKLVESSRKLVQFSVPLLCYMWQQVLMIVIRELISPPPPLQLD